MFHESETAAAHLEMSQRLLLACEVASLAHAGHLRKGTDVPYISHLMGVALLVQAQEPARFGADTEDCVIAALLHDVMEDVPENYSWERMEADFGPQVVRIVRCLTKDATLGSWQARSDAYLAKMEVMDADAVIVAACDKLYNLTATLRDLQAAGPAGVEEFWSRFNAGAQQQLWWYSSVTDAVVRRLPELPAVAELRERVKQLRTWV